MCLSAGLMNQSRWNQWALPALMEELYRPYFGTAHVSVQARDGNGASQPITGAVVVVTYGTRSVHVTRKKTAADGSIRFGGWAGKASPVPHEVRVSMEGYEDAIASVQIVGRSSVNLTITMNVSSSAGSARKPVIDQVLKADDEELAHREEAADSGHLPAGIGECVKIPEPIVISERPKVLFYEDFLSHEICDWMIATADPLMQPSDVTGGGADERGARRSHAHSFSSLEQRAAPIREIKKRINNVTGLHTSLYEDLQVQRYRAPSVSRKRIDNNPDGKPEFYIPHLDTGSQEVQELPGGRRQATMVLFLSDVEEGGETFFSFVKNIIEPPKSEP